MRDVGRLHGAGDSRRGYNALRQRRYQWQDEHSALVVQRDARYGRNPRETATKQRTRARPGSATGSRHLTEHDATDSNAGGRRGHMRTREWRELPDSSQPPRRPSQARSPTTPGERAERRSNARSEPTSLNTRREDGLGTREQTRYRTDRE